MQVNALLRASKVDILGLRPPLPQASLVKAPGQGTIKHLLELEMELNRPLGTTS